MRELKFKGKVVDSGKWVFGGFTFDSVDIPRITTKTYDKLGLIFNEVIPETIGQFTGMLDKNGREIYEGDIVNFTRSYGNWQLPTSGYGFITDICEIVHDSDCCRFALKYNGNIQKLRKHSGYEYEVIGNIYDNAELLNNE